MFEGKGLKQPRHDREKEKKGAEQSMAYPTFLLVSTYSLKNTMWYRVRHSGAEQQKCVKEHGRLLKERGRIGENDMGKMGARGRDTEVDHWQW